MSPHSLRFLPRRLANAAAGHGPWRLRTFEEIRRLRTSTAAHGVHRPEYFDGVILEEPADALFYTPSHPLLRQTADWEIIDGRPRYLSGGLACPDPKRLYSMSDAGVAGSDGVVYCPDSRAAVTESVRRWIRPADTHPVLGAVRIPPSQQLPGLSLSIAALDTQGFYHFLHEALPRLWLARAHLGSASHILVTGPEDALRAAWLREAGILMEKVVWLGAHAHYRCEQLLFADLPMRDYQPGPWNCAALRNLLGWSAPSGHGTEKIWISRADARSRRFEWEDALIERLPGFRKVVLTGLSPREQMTLFSSARVVAGPHGAGLAGLAFTPAGGKFVELFPPGRLQPIYARLAQACGIHASWACVDFECDDSRDVLATAINEWIAVNDGSR